MAQDAKTVVNLAIASVKTLFGLAIASVKSQNGHLYKRVSGAWVDYYTPYNYPHPFISSPAGGGSVTIECDAMTCETLVVG